MKSIYAELIESVQNGKRFRIDLKEKSVKIETGKGWKYLIERGEWDNERKLIDDSDYVLITLSTSLKEAVQSLFLQYKESAPTTTVLGGESYFKALDLDDLTDAQLAYNMNRNEAHMMLEGYILCKGLQSDELKNELFGENDHWFFWQDEKEKELVILREWV